MLNPRDVYIQACGQLGIDTGKDYFSYTYPLEEGFADKKLIKNLRKLLQEGRSDNKPLFKAYSLFSDWNNRIFIEALLMYFTIDELCTIKGMNRSTLECYCHYFFNVNEIKELDDRMVFLGVINIPAVKTWFDNCSTREIEDIAYRFTGKPRRDTEVMTTMKRVFDKVAATCETFISLKPSTLQSLEFGISAEQRSLFDIALKSGDLMVKLGTMIMKDPGEDKEDFISSWQIEVISDGPEVFDKVLPPAQEEMLMEMMNEVNPIKSIPDSFSEADIQSDSG